MFRNVRDQFIHFIITIYYSPDDRWNSFWSSSTMLKWNEREPLAWCFWSESLIFNGLQQVFLRVTTPTHTHIHSLQTRTNNESIWIEMICEQISTDLSINENWSANERWNLIVFLYLKLLDQQKEYLFQWMWPILLRLHYTREKSQHHLAYCLLRQCFVWTIRSPKSIQRLDKVTIDCYRHFHIVRSSIDLFVYKWTSHDNCHSFSVVMKRWKRSQPTTITKINCVVSYCVDVWHFVNALRTLHWLFQFASAKRCKSRGESNENIIVSNCLANNLPKPFIFHTHMANATGYKAFTSEVSVICHIA